MPQMEEAALVFSHLAHRTRFEHLVDGCNRCPDWQPDRVLVTDALAVEDAIGQRDAKTQSCDLHWT